MGSIGDSQIAASHSTKHGKLPFDVVDSTIRFHEKDNQFWWEKTGGPLAVLLEKAGYSKAEQYNELLFYALHVVPELGPSPDADGNMRWRSPQTSDGTPIDLSWEWGLDGKGVIRTSFEPIGHLAGTSADPSNSYATGNWVRYLENQGLVATLDLQWYHHFMNEMLPSDFEKVQMTEKLKFELAPYAGTFVTRDIGRSGPIVKLYIFPGLKAQELGTSNLEVVERAIRSLPPAQYESLNAEPLLGYLQEAFQKWKMEVLIFSIDLISPKEARIKIYTRAPNTTEAYLMDALTLGGRYEQSIYSEEALADAIDFWKTFIGDAPDTISDGQAERAGPGFYFTLGAGKPSTPKIYISPMSFCSSEIEVLGRLRQFFSRRKNADKMLPQMDRYDEAMRMIYPKKYLEDQSGCHFYVSLALQKDQCRVVTYLCPRTLDQENDARQVMNGKR